MEQLIENINHSQLVNLKAEVFFEESLRIFRKEDPSLELWCKKMGMVSRVASRDILEVRTKFYAQDDQMKEAIFIDLAKNSLYHKLPEILFHPLNLQQDGTSKEKILLRMKTEQKKADEYLEFFAPFDTELFKNKVRLSNRHIYAFSDPSNRALLIRTIKKIINKDINLSNTQYYTFFRKLTHNSELKENLPALEKLLNDILGYKVKLNYIDKYINDDIYTKIGQESYLGNNMGLFGEFKAEHQDLKATLCFNQDLNIKQIQQEYRKVESLLEFFILAIRDIHLECYFEHHRDFIIGERMLYYGTVLA